MNHHHRQPQDPYTPYHPDALSAHQQVHRTLPRSYLEPPSYRSSTSPYQSNSPYPINSTYPISSPYPSSSSSSPYRDELTDPHEEVRKTNLAVQLVNGMISQNARYAQLQPKMDNNARFPQEFMLSRTVDDVRNMDSTTIDRLLSFYQLPTDLRSFSLKDRDRGDVPAQVVKQAKLCTLFDFLGASRLADHERWKAEQWKRDLGVLAF